jgi:hypothetical protein
MKPFILITLSLLCGTVFAENYRYKILATTGLAEQVFDTEGKQTTIIFSRKSNEEARFVLSKILDLDISGTKNKTLWRGAPFEQAIIVNGKLESKILRTPSAPHLAAAENYQEFTLNEVAIRFPLVLNRAGKLFDTGYLETHFSYDTLFPDGLTFNGKNIDFSKYTATKKAKSQ